MITIPKSVLQSDWTATIVADGTGRCSGRDLTNFSRALNPGLVLQLFRKPDAVDTNLRKTYTHIRETGGVRADYKFTLVCACAR